jgi:hypothetical protein
MDRILPFHSALWETYWFINFSESRGSDYNDLPDLTTLKNLESGMKF